MRMIADILECPFRLSIMSVEVQPQRSTAALERAAAMRTDAVEHRKDLIAEQAAETLVVIGRDEVKQEAPGEQDEQETAAAVQQEETAPGERDMTIGELYDMHRELSELEESVKAGEPVEEIRKELEKPKREGFLRGGLFLRRKQHKNTPAPSAEPEGEAQTETAQGVAADAGKSDTGKPDTAAASEENRKEETVSAQDAVRAEEVQDKRQPETDSRKEDDFEPVIPQHDAEEDAAAGEVNPYTGREYQSNSVRMHPTRIGYVQVYDRTIHKWTDMTEWAFLGLQERKKALLGKAYEPPIYLD